MGILLDVGKAAWGGLGDALAFHRSLVFFLTSKTVRVKTLQCFVLNGVIFVGSMLLMTYVVSPLVSMIVSTDDDDDPALAAVANAIDSAFKWAYMLLWNVPIYAISQMLSFIWYQDIADHAFMTKGGRRQQQSLTLEKWVNAMAEKLYMLLLLVIFTIQIYVSTLVPVIGPLLSFVQLCWLYSLYCFEYKWNLKRWDLAKRLDFFERNWAYFLGFGFPSAIVTVASPGLISTGVYAFVFPMFIILAITGKPLGHSQSYAPKKGEGTDANAAPHKDVRIPIFRYAMRANTFAVRNLVPRGWMCLCKSKKGKRSTGTTQSGATENIKNK